MRGYLLLFCPKAVWGVADSDARKGNGDDILSASEKAQKWHDIQVVKFGKLLERQHVVAATVADAVVKQQAASAELDALIASAEGTLVKAKETAEATEKMGKDAIQNAYDSAKGAAEGVMNDVKSGAEANYATWVADLEAHHAAASKPVAGPPPVVKTEEQARAAQQETQARAVSAAYADKAIQGMIVAKRLARQAVQKATEASEGKVPNPTFTMAHARQMLDEALKTKSQADRWYTVAQAVNNAVPAYQQKAGNFLQK